MADISDSMSPADKIGALNESVREMIESFADENDTLAEIQVAVITFGGVVHMHIPLRPASQVRWKDMATNGNTPMGEAFDMAADLVEDRGQISSRSYRPMMILISDGQPTDGGYWQTALDRLNTTRAAKAERFALGIGADADRDMLKQYVATASGKVFGASDASQIRKFFRLMTISAIERSRISDPNEQREDISFDLEEL